MSLGVSHTQSWPALCTVGSDTSLLWTSGLWRNKCGWWMAYQCCDQGKVMCIQWALKYQKNIFFKCKCWNDIPWLSARLQWPQCISNWVTAVLLQAINIMLLLVTMTKLWNIDMWNVSTENSSIYFRIQILISQMMFPRFHASCKTKLLASYVQIHVKISSKLWTFIVWKTVEFEALDHCYFVSEQEVFGLSCRGGQKVGVQKSPQGMCVFLMWWSLIQRELHQQISSNGIEILLCLSRLKLSNQHKSTTALLLSHVQNFVLIVWLWIE